MVLSSGERCQELLIQIGTQRMRAAVHRRPKKWLSGVKLESGARIRSVTAKHERNARPVFSCGLPGAQHRPGTLGRLPCRNGSEHIAQLLLAFYNDGHAAREMRSAGIGGKADVRKVIFGMPGEMLFEVARQILDRTFRPRGKSQDVAGAARQAFRPGPGRSFFDNDVRVRAAET